MSEDDITFNLHGLSAKAAMINLELEDFTSSLQMVAVISAEDGDEETLAMTEQCMSKLTDAHAKIKELGSIIDNMERMRGYIS